MTSLGMKGRYFRAMMAMKMGIAPEPEAQVLALPTTARLAPLIQRAIQAQSASPRT